MPLAGGDRPEAACGWDRLPVVVQPPTDDLARLPQAAGVIVARGDCGERSRRCHGLAGVVASPAGDLARSEQGASVRFAGCDCDGARAGHGHAGETFAGRVSLAVPTVAPAADLAVARHPAGVPATGADLDVAAGRGVRLAPSVVAPTARGAVLGQGARPCVAPVGGEDAPRALAPSSDLDDAIARRARFAAVGVVIDRRPPAVRLASLCKRAGVVVADADLAEASLWGSGQTVVVVNAAGPPHIPAPAAHLPGCGQRAGEVIAGADLCETAARDIADAESPAAHLPRLRERAAAIIARADLGEAAT